MEIKDRIMQFIDYKGITKNKFEVLCGLPKRYVSNIGKEIQSDAIKKIILVFPEINLNWLISGKGEMLENGMAKDERRGENRDDVMMEIVEQLKRMSDIQERHIQTTEMLAKMLNHLWQQKEPESEPQKIASA